MTSLPPLAPASGAPGARVRAAGRAGRIRWRLGDGAVTTVHVARHARAGTRLRVALLDEPAPLAAWCAARGVREAMVGGFFVSGTARPLGELWVDGRRVPSEPFADPWPAHRSCLAVAGEAVAIGRLGELPPGPGDLLQAGPRLVADGRAVARDGHDHEGFSAGAAQFDSDITDGRHPRAALGVTADELIAVVCDGRHPHDAGLTLGELAALMAALGAREAINLDGGGSAALVAGGRLRNTPRGGWLAEIPGGRPIVTALVFAPAGAQTGPATSS
ncbi:phosphodiester glycosidase family protein [Miltoncostaea marina]|uniref:phosphodiester glycosidase family protein n=1 Tax=Miltoncostaea marina TaxID=2843215 RepID=UPI001C3D00E6|nr:phosphodiester glycosidase family protein [Miltoncostaea marina]